MSFVEFVHCNTDVCPCRTLERPGDVHGDDVVDDHADDAMHGGAYARAAFAHDGSCCGHVASADAPSASSPSSTA